MSAGICFDDEIVGDNFIPVLLKEDTGRIIGAGLRISNELTAFGSEFLGEPVRENPFEATVATKSLTQAGLGLKWGNVSMQQFIEDDGNGRQPEAIRWLFPDDEMKKAPVEVTKELQLDESLIDCSIGNIEGAEMWLEGHEKISNDESAPAVGSQARRRSHNLPDSLRDHEGKVLAHCNSCARRSRTIRLHDGNGGWSVGKCVLFAGVAHAENAVSVSRCQLATFEKPTKAMMAKEGDIRNKWVQCPPASCHAVSGWESQETGASFEGHSNQPPAFVSGSCLSVVDDALRNWVDELRKPDAAATSQDATKKVESVPSEGDSENDPILVVHQPSEKKNKKRRNGGGRNTRRSKKGRAARRGGASAAAASRKSESACDITESEDDEHESAARIKAECERKLAAANERCAESGRMVKQLLARVAAMEAQSTQSAENATEQSVPAPKLGTSKATQVSKAGPNARGEKNARRGGKSAAHDVDGFECGSDDSTDAPPPQQVCHTGTCGLSCHKNCKRCIGCGRCIRCCCSGGHPQTRQQLRKQVHRKMKRKARKRKKLHKIMAMTMKNKLMKLSERDHAIDAAVREVGDELASSDSSSTDYE
eukprot:jgi/Bigna1/74499/fgenesh1_pg.29_\